MLGIAFVLRKGVENTHYGYPGFPPRWSAGQVCSTFVYSPPIVPLYFAKERPVVNIDGNLIMADDDRLPEEYRDRIEMKKVRFRTLGCWPLTGAVESDADTIEKIVEEMMTTTKSERTTRVIDFDQDASMEQKKREGYF